MADLMQLQNQLRGLSDESLNQTMSSPEVPPFLVLSEVSRRKEARKRYDGEMARRGKQTTVFEDLVGSPPPAVSPMMSRPATPMGAGMGVPPEGGPPMGGMGALPMPPPANSGQGLAAIPGFDIGGPIDYEAIESQYAEQLSGLGGQDDNARAMALIAAGAAMMGNGSSNFMKNLGAGASAGLGSYQDQMKIIDNQEAALLRDVVGYGRGKSADELAAMEYERQKENDARAAMMEERRLELQKQGLVPTSIAEWERFNGMTEEEQASYLKLNPAPASADARLKELRADVDRAYEARKKEALATLETNIDFMAGTEAERAAILAEIDRAAYEQAFTQVQTLNPGSEDYISVLRNGLQLSAPAATAAPPSSDPLELGL